MSENDSFERRNISECKSELWNGSQTRIIMQNLITIESNISSTPAKGSAANNGGIDMVMVACTTSNSFLDSESSLSLFA